MLNLHSFKMFLTLETVKDIWDRSKRHTLPLLWVENVLFWFWVVY